MILWDGEPEDIYALAGMDIDYRYSEGLSFIARFGDSYSRYCKAYYAPNCVELLGDAFDFRDVEFCLLYTSP